MTYCYSVYHDNFRDSTGQCTGIHRRITGSSPGRTAVRASQGIGFASPRVLDRLVRLCKPVIKAAMPPFANENQLRSKTFLIFQPNYNKNKRSSQCDYVPYKIGKLQIQGFSEPTTPKNKITELSHYAEGRPVKTTGGLFAWKARKEAEIF